MVPRDSGKEPWASGEKCECVARDKPPRSTGTATRWIERQCRGAVPPRHLIGLRGNLLLSLSISINSPSPVHSPSLHTFLSNHHHGPLSLLTTSLSPIHPLQSRLSHLLHLLSHPSNPLSRPLQPPPSHQSNPRNKHPPNNRPPRPNPLPTAKSHPPPRSNHHPNRPIKLLLPPPLLQTYSLFIQLRKRRNTGPETPRRPSPARRTGPNNPENLLRRTNTPPRRRRRFIPSKTPPSAATG